jgi:predicted hydrocarbon binding protein
MLTAARVPEPMKPLFETAEGHVRKHFEDIKLAPDQGTIHIGEERYVFIRAESLYLAWFEALAQSFGEETAHEFIYNTAREIGKADSKAFAEARGVTDGIARLASGPVHFAYSGWAFVDILPTSAPASDETYFLHYEHPNTFESEVLIRRKIVPAKPACLFSAGYSAGWCSEAFGVQVHGRELRCRAQGDPKCEFIMAPYERLGEHERRVRAAW